METYWTECNVAYCDTLVQVASDGLGLVVCEACRQAIWGDEPPHYEDEGEIPRQ